jgi:hypothetical protein
MDVAMPIAALSAAPLMQEVLLEEEQLGDHHPQWPPHFQLDRPGPRHRHPPLQNRAHRFPSRATLNLITPAPFLTAR